MTNPKLKDGVFEIELTKSETAAGQKFLDALRPILGMSPVKPDITDAAKAAIESAVAVLDMIGNGDPNQPLLPGIKEASE
jgi:poly(3-hydroxybutyrate) depolymerase